MAHRKQLPQCPADPGKQLPQGRSDRMPVPNQKHNGAHLPATHRLDLSLTYRFAPRRGAAHSLNLSVYNLYARRNVLFRYMGFEGESFGLKSVYSLCRMLPSVGYNIKF